MSTSTFWFWVSGLGKTTFIRQFLRSYVENGAPVVQGEHDGSSTSLEQFERDPDSLRIQLGPIPIPGQPLRLTVALQETPGWDADMNVRKYAKNIVRIILEQRKKDYNQLQGDRAMPEDTMKGRLQNSISACLYFLPPQRVKPIDMILMSAFSQLAIVIPIIAKADTMTEDETVRYRQEVLQQCLNPISCLGRTDDDLPELKMDIFRFDDSVLKELKIGRDHQLPPFTIITSDGVNDKGQPIRRYPWGESNGGHSDFILLKRLLMGDQNKNLWRLTADAYNRYQVFGDQFEAANNELDVLVEDACKMWQPHLTTDDSSESSQLAIIMNLHPHLQQQHKQLQSKYQAIAWRSKYAWTAVVLLLCLVVLQAYVHDRRRKC